MSWVKSVNMNFTANAPLKHNLIHHLYFSGISSHFKAKKIHYLWQCFSSTFINCCIIWLCLIFSNLDWECILTENEKIQSCLTRTKQNKLKIYIYLKTTTLSRWEYIFFSFVARKLSNKVLLCISILYMNSLLHRIR